MLFRSRAAQSQGLRPATQGHLDEVWEVFRRAGRASQMYRNTQGDEEQVLKDLILQSVTRFADSLASRLAAWRRWEAWALSQGKGPNIAFKPTDLMLGKYLREISRGGPTAAKQAWASLKWWATKLGLTMPLESPLVNDFRLRRQGHITRQAGDIPLEVVTRLRMQATAKIGRAHV